MRSIVSLRYQPPHQKKKKKKVAVLLIRIETFQPPVVVASSFLTLVLKSPIGKLDVLGMFVSPKPH